jgi:hypothetical protein
MNKQIKYVLFVHNSKADIYGNRYYSMSVIRTTDGASAYGTISGGESNCTYALRKLAESEGVEFTYSIREYPIREYNRIVKGWQYIGCTDDQIISEIQKQFNNPA